MLRLFCFVEQWCGCSFLRMRGRRQEAEAAAAAPLASTFLALWWCIGVVEWVRYERAKKRDKQHVNSTPLSKSKEGHASTFVWSGEPNPLTNRESPTHHTAPGPLHFWPGLVRALDQIKPSLGCIWKESMSSFPTVCDDFKSSGCALCKCLGSAGTNLPLPRRGQPGFGALFFAPLLVCLPCSTGIACEPGNALHPSHIYQEFKNCTHECTEHALRLCDPPPSVRGCCSSWSFSTRQHLTDLTHPSLAHPPPAQAPPPCRGGKACRRNGMWTWSVSKSRSIGMTSKVSEAAVLAFGGEGNQCVSRAL